MSQCEKYHIGIHSPLKIYQNSSSEDYWLIAYSDKANAVNLLIL